MKRVLVVLLTLYCIVPARCATRKLLTRADWALLAADAGARGLDVYSTRRMLERGNRELVLPEALARSTPAMAAYSAAWVGAEYLLMRVLRRRHARLARAVPIIDAGSVAPWAVHNLLLPRRQARAAIQAPR